MAEVIPIFSGDDERVIAWFRDAPITQALARVSAARLAAALPEATHLVNLCSNRYYFLLAWLAAGERGQLVLLPSDQSAGTLDALRAAYPSLAVVDDAQVETLLDGACAAASIESSIAPDRILAIAFTSGSTGQPQAHAKRWRTLARNAQLAALRVLGGAGAHIVATVPPQHAYGLETSVMSALSAGCVLYDERPFFPHDVKAALESIPEPRTLVTTPTHLHALQSAGVALPPVRNVVSATAPLSRELALDAERRCGGALHEIYGCTEAGVVAWRRTSETEVWRVFDGGRVFNDGDGAWYAAPQFDERIALQDVIEPIGETQFRLHGRATDMIKVAGKRASLAGLTEQLKSIAGVQDAVVFMPSAQARPAALVVAPGVSTEQIAAALSAHVDPVFVPRPLVSVAALPRNAVGKLPHDALLRAIGKPGS